MLRLLKYFKTKEWVYAAIGVFFIVFQVYLDLKMPDYTKNLTQLVTEGNVTMQDVLSNGGMMLLCAFGSLASSIICGFFAARVAAGFAFTLRKEIFNTVESYSNEEMEQFSTPSLITRSTNDVVQMQNLIAMGLQVVIKAPILAIWAIAKISNTSIEWTSAVLIAVLVMTIMVVVLVVLCLPKFRKIQKLTDNLNEVTRENLTGIRVVRAFNAEDYQEEKFEKANDDITKNHLFTARSMGVMMPVMSLVMSGLSLAIYWIGAYLIEAAPVLEKAIIFGEMSAFMQYSMQIVMAFMLLVMIFIILPRCIVSGRRISEVLRTKPTINDGNYVVKSNDKVGEI